MMRLDNGAGIGLGAVIARAGEGTIYEVVGRRDWVAKIFHSDLKDIAAKRAKVAAMIASPPEGGMQADGFVVLTWPLHMVIGDDGAAGYVMPRLDTSNAVEIHTVSNPSNRANPLPAAPQWPRHVSWHHLVNIAANLCLAVETVHRVDAVIGDFQERNILVNDTTRVSLVDCDSMQFTDGFGHQFLCGVGRAEFTAPELARVDLARQARDKPSDLFALAVHVHLLLMAGNHPFLRGEWVGGGEQPDAMSLAISGQWAGGPQSKLRTHPLAPPVKFLPPEIQRLFARAFTDGARDPRSRPSAAEWRQNLQRMQIGTCARGHQIPVEAQPCPWCVIDDVRAVRRRAQTASALPQKSMPVIAPRPMDLAASGNRSTSPSAPSGTRRNVMIGIGIGVFVTAVATVMALALGGADSPGPAGAGAPGGTTNYGASNENCHRAPRIGQASLSLTEAGLAVDIPMTANCAAGLELSGADVHVTVSDGAKDVAAGRFDFSIRPVVVSGQVTQRLVFPAGMYWRTPDLVSPSVSVDLAGLNQDVADGRSAAGTSLIANGPLQPAHGDFDSVAAAALSELSGSDHAVAQNSIADHWVPQISSKRVGLVTDGITYRDQDILRDHLMRRQLYDGVRLLWSGHWTTFNGANWWVTVVDAPSGDAAIANGWCDMHNIDSWNCFAKYVSDRVGPDGTTVIRR
ncbi:hypothetical protein [Mycobacterium sp. SMC-4]|uniref:hypothetical protein n=1 Tax=Mycobacterium sp. SMC-4 TaxID=2857059 RepID=UPI0021B4AD0A|nr:hypothetical protein [Mycobacterium sp. SMC-4]UXA19114.1 hypothetical protein KXD98_05560 [Mycobacterium sp. SMC-4]